MELMVNGRTMEDFCATVEKDKIRIASDRIQAKDRISLRYAWKDWMVTNVYSSMGPVSVFYTHLDVYKRQGSAIRQQNFSAV